MNGIFGPLEGIAIRAPAGAWSLAVATVHRTVALSRSSFESLLKKEIPRLDETRNFLTRSKGLRFARLRALGRSRSQQSTGLLLCPARPSNPFLKKIPRLGEARNFLARSKGFEPPIFRIGICCVIQLRHERNYQALYYTSKCSECQVRRPFFSRVKSTVLSRPRSVRRRATRLLSSLARARRISHTRRGS